MMFLPATHRVQPIEVDLPGVVEVTLRNESGDRLYSWYGKAEAGQPTILFFHGNGGSIPTRHERFRQWMSEGFGMFMLGYPGYGGSDGVPSERTFREASQLAYDFLREQGVSAEDIVIYGQSIGTGVAVWLASEQIARALILEAPMTSAIDVAETHYPYLPVSLLLKDKFLSIDYVGKIDMPLLIVHGDADQIIGIEHGRSLFEAAIEPKAFFQVKGAGHNNLISYPIVETIKEYVVNL